MELEVNWSEEEEEAGEVPQRRVGGGRSDQSVPVFNDQSVTATLRLPLGSAAVFPFSAAGPAP